jgi:transposase
MRRAGKSLDFPCGPYGPTYTIAMSDDADLAVAQATIAQQATRIQELERQIDVLRMEAATLRQGRESDQSRLASMQRRIRQLLREIYGPRSEGHHADPAVVADLLRNPSPPEPNDHVDADAPAAATPTPEAPSSAGPGGAAAGAGSPAPEADGVPGALLTPVGNGAGASTKPGRQGRKPGGRMTLPEWLALQEVIIDLPESERRGSDGVLLPCIDERISWRLDYVPAHFERVRIIHLIYGLPYGDEPRLFAPVPPAVVARGLPTDRLVAQVVADKFDLHLPLYRQEGLIDVLGLNVSRATLVNWVARAADILAPIQAAIGAAVLAQPVLGLDDTYLPVLEPGKGRCHQGRLWGYLAGDDFYCEYRATREGRWPAEFLAGYRGTVLGDAYSGHHGLFVTGERTPAGCLSHARRKFDAAVKLGETRAQHAMDHFSALYAVERSVADRPPDAVLEARRATSVGILDKLGILLEGWLATELPSSATYVAANYTLKIYPQLRQFTKDGRVPIDNNALERCWRGVGIGRRNWLFAGSPRGGTSAATLITICQSCRLVGVDVRAYLVDIFAELHAGRTDYAALRPAAWAARRDSSAKSG